MAKAAKKKAPPKKRAAKYEEKVKTVLSSDELIAMSVGKKELNKKEKPGKG
jgi:hypothetical protein